MRFARKLRRYCPNVMFTSLFLVLVLCSMLLGYFPSQLRSDKKYNGGIKYEHHVSNLKTSQLLDDTEAIEAIKQFRFQMRYTDPEVRHLISGGHVTTDVMNRCRNLTYDLNVLPSASVVIAFHSAEHVESLLHTIHSVYDVTPEQLLQEIILIDDNSNKASHKGPLEEYIAANFPAGLFKFYHHHGDEPLGVARARQLGIELASADVVVCMDSHMEVQQGWLEPLLEAIKQHPKTLASSSLDEMTADKPGSSKWTYTTGGPKLKTMWDWRLFTTVIKDARMEELDRFDTVLPVTTPITVGTIWAIDRQFFWDIGGLDDQMKVYGAEHIDLSLKVYLCGEGRVVKVPCSKAAHQQVPHPGDYLAGWRQQSMSNYKRLSAVWLDGEYKETFDYHNQDLADQDVGDISQNLQQKQSCPHSFSHYMDRIYPELGVDAQSFGWQGLMNLGSGLCLQFKAGETEKVQMGPCTERYAVEQTVFLSLTGHLRYHIYVLTLVQNKHTGQYVFKDRDNYFDYFKRDEHTVWMHTKGGCMYSPKHGLCLGTLNNTIIVSSCSGNCTNNAFMQWRFSKYTHYYDQLKHGDYSFLKENTVRDYYEKFKDYILSLGFGT